MPVDPDPRAHVASTVDFYALLSISEDFDPSSLKSSYRKATIRYHPDKAVKPDASEKEKEDARDNWDIFVVAKKVLEDPALRSQYDNARAARVQKRKRDAAYGAHRQQMIDRLEQRERTAKRSADRMTDSDDPYEGEIRRLAAEGARQREALMAKRRAEAKAAQNSIQGSRSRSPNISAPSEEPFTVNDPLEQDSAPQDSSSSSGDSQARTLKVRFAADPEPKFDSGTLVRLFEVFGPVDAVVMGSVKRERLEPGAKKQSLGRSFVQFKDIQGASSAASSWLQRRQVDSDSWQGILDVAWLLKGSKAGDGAMPATSDMPNTPLEESKDIFRDLGQNGSTNRKSRAVPSFSSFRSSTGAATSTRTASDSKNFQDLVMAKMRDAANKAAERREES